MSTTNIHTYINTTILGTVMSTNQALNGNKIAELKQVLS